MKCVWFARAWFARVRFARVWFVSGYRFSDTASPSKPDAPLGAPRRIQNFPAPTAILPGIVLLGIILVSLSLGCGYHTTASAATLPQNVHTIAIPGFVSHSQTFRVEQLLTDAVVREFNARTQYHVVLAANGDADAVLKATVLSASASPLAYDSQTGRAVSALVTVSVQVTLTDRQGKVLFDNPAYLFHDQYEISRDLPSFFQEDSPAIDRLSRDFARTLVANILEAY